MPLKVSVPSPSQKGVCHGARFTQSWQFWMQSGEKKKHQPLLGWCCGGNDRFTVLESGRRDSNPRPSPWQVNAAVYRWRMASFEIPTFSRPILRSRNTSRRRSCSQALGTAHAKSFEKDVRFFTSYSIFETRQPRSQFFRSDCFAARQINWVRWQSQDYLWRCTF